MPSRLAAVAASMAASLALSRLVLGVPRAHSFASSSSAQSPAARRASDRDVTFLLEHIIF